jgi:DNA adenine methylase
MKKINPVIKWSGSKRNQADKIVGMMPKEIDVYYEPFVGGGSVFVKLATSSIKVNKFVLSDINNDLISLWKTIILDAEGVYKHYKDLWKEMNSIDDWDKKKDYYIKVREKFNVEKSPYDFMFIMRTTFNGMPRYNKNGYFNNPLHPNRNGIIPEKLLDIMLQWKNVIESRNVTFINQSYENITTSENDVIYLDPPYAGIKGMYYGTLDNYNTLWNFLRNQKAKWLLSFDGKTTSEDYVIKIPNDIYKSHEFLENGNSSFRRLNGKSNKEYVFESLYKNYE